MSMIKLRLALLPALFGVVTCQAALIHDFRFQTNLNDSLSGAVLTGLGGTTGATTYDFAAQQGLSLANPALLNTGTYTIAFLFTFTDVGGYRRLIDFKNLTVDTGLYVLNSNLNFYNVVTGSGAPIAANTPVTVALTRDNATGAVTGFVNGVQAFTFNDGSSLGVFSGPSNIMYFFRDDNSVGGEASAGSVNRIMIWDDALSSTAVAALNLGDEPTGGAVVPEPATSAGLASGAALLVALGRRRRRSS